MVRPSLNARTSDGTVFNPQRDLRHMYPQSMQMVADKFHANAWPELNRLCQLHGVGWDDLCDAMEGLGQFMAAPTYNPRKTMEEGLRESGFLDYEPMAQIAIMAMLGTVVIGHMHYAIRETTPLAEVPEGMEDFVEKLRSKLAGNRRFRRARRWWRRLWQRPEPAAGGDHAQ